MTINDGNGYGYGYGSDGASDGDGSGYGSGSYGGYSSNSYGYGYGSGYGGYGSDSDGYGYGYNDSSGYGSDGASDGYGSGYGYGDGCSGDGGYGGYGGYGDYDGKGACGGVFIVDIATPILAYHFVDPASKHAGEALNVAVGAIVCCDPPLKLCELGLHASIEISDARKFAKHEWQLTKVACSGSMIFGNDKLVCSRREIVEIVKQ